MFKVTLHSGVVKDATLHNLLGRLDFGYEKLAAVATYKSELFVCGVGSLGLRHLENYPRWSASIWDLIARLVTVGLYTHEKLPAIPSGPRDKGAYVRNMCAIVEHWADGEETRRARVATAQLSRGIRHCDYACELFDDLTGTRTSQQFRHAPEVLQPWDLLVRGVCWAEAGHSSLPERPPLRVPPVFEEDGVESISMGKLCVQARVGLGNWLARQGLKPRLPLGQGSATVPAKVFTQFLESVL